MSKSKCPIPNSHRRLMESFVMLEDLMQNHNDETRFTISLNNLIQSLRNVTFILQKELAHKDGFEEWYLVEQQRMRVDKKMKWLHDSRNIVVKESDLAKESFAKVSLKDHRDHTIVEVKANPSLDSKHLATIVLKDADIKVPDNLRSRLIVQVEKYWIVSNYKDSEIGTVLIYCLEYLRSLIERVHKDLFCVSSEDCPDLDKNNLSKDNQQVLENLFKNSRIVQTDYETGKTFKKEVLKIDTVPKDLIRKRYGDFRDLKDGQASETGELPFNRMFFHKEMVKKLFSVDGHIVPVAFLYFPDSESIIFSFKFENPAERYLVFEEIANKVKETNCRAVVFVSEAWVGRMPEKGEAYIPPAEQKEKELVMIVAANPKETKSCFFEIIRRRFRKPKLSEESGIEKGEFISFERIYKAWQEMDRDDE